MRHQVGAEPGPFRSGVAANDHPDDSTNDTVELFMKVFLGNKHYNKNFCLVAKLISITLLDWR